MAPTLTGSRAPALGVGLRLSPWARGRFSTHLGSESCDTANVSILGILAAIIPIAGSLYAAGSFLTQQAALSHEHRVRLRIKPYVQSREADAARRLKGLTAETLEWKRIRAEPREFERMMLHYNGIDHPGKTWDDVDLAIAMSAPRVPPIELRRQWVLLLSAGAGLVLVAIDAF